MTKSVYIHIPFCASICTYCDFSKMLYYEKYASRYLDALHSEVKKRYKGEEIETLYIGGGTPSMLNIEELKKLFEIVKIFNLNSLKEFTIECNVSDIDSEKLKLFKKNKVNRISIGVQTFNESVLTKMNRSHDYNLVKEKIDLIKKSGIDNINLDLIYAFPKTTLSDLKEDLDKFFSLDVTHISTYSLMIEPHTMLYIKKVKPINEELDAKMYELIKKEMKKHGYIHYEVSNFCKNGFESKHNLVYWNNLEYYGFGLSASGYIGNIRYTNTLNMGSYLEGKYGRFKEKLTKKDKMVYELILGMRKIEGIDIKNFMDKFKKNILKNPTVLNLIENGSLIVDDNHLKIPYNKMYIQNEILEELLDFE